MLLYYYGLSLSFFFPLKALARAMRNALIKTLHLGEKKSLLCLKWILPPNSLHFNCQGLLRGGHVFLLCQRPRKWLNWSQASTSQIKCVQLAWCSVQHCHHINTSTHIWLWHNQVCAIFAYNMHGKKHSLHRGVEVLSFCLKEAQHFFTLWDLRGESHERLNREGWQ